MSDELRLSDDLAACEARLAGLPLPASGIDRDQLLFQAGWAAAVAAGAGVGKPQLAGFDALRPGASGGIAPRRSIAWRSVAGAALAASLAVVATLVWRPVADRGRVPLAVSRPEAAATDSDRAFVRAVDGLTAESKPPSSSWRLTPAAPSREDWAKLAALLAARNQSWRLAANLGADDRLTSASRSSLYGPPAKTARELMDEYLPGALRPGEGETAPRGRLGWPWNSASPGETI